MGVEEEIIALLRISQFHRENREEDLVTFYTWQPHPHAELGWVARGGYSVCLSLSMAVKMMGYYGLYQGTCPARWIVEHYSTNWTQIIDQPTDVLIPVEKYVT